MKQVLAVTESESTENVVRSTLRARSACKRSKGRQRAKADTRQAFLVLLNFGDFPGLIFLCRLIVDQLTDAGIFKRKHCLNRASANICMSFQSAV